jgi:hypothetical protein
MHGSTSWTNSSMSDNASNSIDNLISVLKSKFLPQMRTADVTNRNRNQQTVETYITKEFTQVCQKLLRIVDTANDNAQFTILFSVVNHTEVGPNYKEHFQYKCLLSVSHHHSRKAAISLSKCQTLSQTDPIYTV